MLSIRAEADIAGDSVDAIAHEMMILAEKLNARVRLRFNGVEMVADPGESARKLIAAYREAVRSGESEMTAYSDGQADCWTPPRPVSANLSVDAA